MSTLPPSHVHILGAVCPLPIDKSSPRLFNDSVQVSTMSTSPSSHVHILSAVCPLQIDKRSLAKSMPRHRDRFPFVYFNTGHRVNGHILDLWSWPPGCFDGRRAPDYQGRMRGVEWHSGLPIRTANSISVIVAINKYHYSPQTPGTIQATGPG
ncbi:hypothetical protein NLI96_g2554 [Meripilus lineatus]|uniref:Uncharacterized protein n=1 Tax=Meripilus lineatus TaxID=2056292 RepID=A0AAD5V8F9_9APHY|nr:hypothetical protein NLI96_g2554 [Physisporinus lineatus]